MEKLLDKFTQGIKELKRELYEQKKGIQNLEELINTRVEREPGIWEYDFEELESEIWNKYSRIEKRIQDLSNEILRCSGRSPKNIFRFFKNLRGNLIRQNVINQEITSFYLTVILNLQKIKDRLNSLEYKVERISKEKEEIISEIEEYKSQQIRKKEK